VSLTAIGWWVIPRHGGIQHLTTTTTVLLEEEKGLGQVEILLREHPIMIGVEEGEDGVQV